MLTFQEQGHASERRVTAFNHSASNVSSRLLRLEVKTGMLATSEIVSAVAASLKAGFHSSVITLCRRALKLEQLLSPTLQRPGHLQSLQSQQVRKCLSDRKQELKIRSICTRGFMEAQLQLSTYCTHERDRQRRCVWPSYIPGSVPAARNMLHRQSAGAGSLS